MGEKNFQRERENEIKEKYEDENSREREREKKTEWIKKYCFLDESCRMNRLDSK